MTPQEQAQNARIAEALGWTLAPAHQWGWNQGFRPKSTHALPDEMPETLPNFLTSDAAAREMLEGLGEDEKIKFVFHLRAIVARARGALGMDSFDLIHATPRQKAKAFCKVRGIKWEVEG